MLLSLIVRSVTQRVANLKVSSQTQSVTRRNYMILCHSDSEAVGKGDDHPILFQSGPAHAVERTVSVIGEGKSVLALKIFYLSISSGRANNCFSIETVAGPVMIWDSRPVVLLLQTFVLVGMERFDQTAAVVAMYPHVWHGFTDYLDTAIDALLLQRMPCHIWIHALHLFERCL